MRPTAIATAISLGATFTALGQQTEPVPLERGRALELTLGPQGVHSFAIELAARDCVRVTVEPREAGVVVALAGPDGKSLIEVDATAGAAQAVSVAAAGAGSYRLDVKPLEKNPAPGRYRLSIDGLASAPRDGLLADQAIHAEADRNRDVGSAQSLALASEQYQAALQGWRAAGERRWEGQALWELTDVQSLLSQNTVALDSARELLALADEVGAPRLKARTLNLIGFVRKAIGDEAASQAYQDGLATLARVHDPMTESHILNNLAIVYSDAGDKQQALAHYQKALELVHSLGDKAGEAHLLHNLATFYYDLGEQRRGVEFLEQALSLRRASGDRRGEGATLTMLGQAYRALGEVQKGLELSLQAVRLQRELGDRRGEGDALARAGLAYERAGDAAKGLEHLREALQVYREIPDPQGQSDVLRVLGQRSVQAGRPEEGLRQLSEALAIARQLGERQRQALTLLWLARAQRDLGDFASARRHGEVLLAILESLRNSLPHHQLRGALFASAQEFYDFYIDLLMQQHLRKPAPALVAAALEAYEQSHARSFLDLLSEGGGASPAQTGDAALLERDRELEQRLAAAAERQLKVLGSGGGTAEADAFSKEIQALTREHDLVEALIHAASPRSTGLTTQSLNAAQIQSDVLDDGMLLLAYHLGAERSYLWAVSRQGVAGYELPKGDDINRSARRWHELLSARPELAPEGGPRVPTAPESGELREAAVALSAMLLSPVADRLAGQRLLVVADGALQYVPFAALPLPGKGDTPLVVEHPVVAAPSASTLAALRRQLAGRPRAQKTLAVLADPVFDQEDERLAPGRRAASRTTGIETPAPRASDHDLARAAREAGLRDGNISRLPFTRREARAILALVPPAQRLEALDFRASRSLATSAELARYRYVHFATHGFLNSAHPELSGIVLSLVDRGGRRQDGFLAASQVFTLRLPVELVVLSGCRTALGNEVLGEGLVGLTRSFLSAGAARVVASLWKVDDAATAELMRTLYQRMLRDGKPAADALRSAQVAMWKNKRWSAPYYWAAFVIQGEWR